MSEPLEQPLYTPKGWPYLGPNHYLDVTPAYTHGLAQKLDQIQGQFDSALAASAHVDTVKTAVDAAADEATQAAAEATQAAAGVPKAYVTHLSVSVTPKEYESGQTLGEFVVNYPTGMFSTEPAVFAMMKGARTPQPVTVIASSTSKLAKVRLIAGPAGTYDSYVYSVFFAAIART